MEAHKVFSIIIVLVGVVLISYPMYKRMEWNTESIVVDQALLCAKRGKGVQDKTDVWHNKLVYDFRVENIYSVCTVTSAGKDFTLNTKDDIRYTATFETHSNN